MAEAKPDPASGRGLTVRSIFASLLVILVAGTTATFAAVLDGGQNSQLGSEALPVPALLAFLPFALAAAGVGALARTRIFSRQELTCVLFASMIATPILTTGFWRYELAGLSTVLRSSDWTKLDALPDGLWPHGENVLAGTLPSGETRSPSGRVTHHADAVTLSSTTPGAVTALRVRLGVGEATSGEGAAPLATPGRPYLFSALVRADRLDGDASYAVRIYADDEPSAAFEPVSGRKLAEPSLLRPDGFVRVGQYPLLLPRARRTATVELALVGSGSVTFRAPLLCDVSAIESAYSGFARVTPREYAALPLAERQGVLVVPDRLFSVNGLKYTLGLGYPLRDWVRPIARLGAFVLLVFATTLGLALVFRKKWLESERYALPMARIPLVLLGAEPADGGLGARFWRERWLWVGFGLALPWALLRVARGYDPTLPDLSFRTGLKGYFADPGFGLTWDGVEFKVLVTFFALGLLMELNVLLSLVTGYFAFRLEYWAGMARGLNADQDFPYFSHQMLGGTVVYAVILVLSARRYLFEVGRGALARTAGESGAERSGLALLALGLIGFVLWGRWLGMSLAGVLVLSGYVVLLGFVAGKLRAECGLPLGGFNHPLGQSQYEGPVAVFLLLPLLGGVSFFGGETAMVMTLVTAIVLPVSFFNVPGMQVELLEVGRRFGIRPLELGLTALFGVVAAIGIGGWLYLMTLYGFGAVHLPVASEFGDRIGAFRTFNAELARAPGMGALAGSTLTASAPAWAVLFGAAVTALVTALGRFFPGFWFHPIGLLAGPSGMMTELWGSLLCAYVVRSTVLRVGGARAVREKLVPVAVGIFLAALLAHAVYIAINARYFFFNHGNIQFRELV